MYGITITGVVMFVILVLFFLFGWKAGLLKSIFDLFSFIFTIILTWLLYPVIAGWMIKTPLYGKIHKLIITTLSNNEEMSESLPEFLMKLPGFMKDSIMNSSKQAFNSLVKSTSEAMTTLTINIISVIILFFIVRFISFLIRKYSSKINKVFLVGKINAFFGGAFGLLQGLFAIYFIVLIISFFPTSGIYDRVASDLEVSYIGKKIFHDNETFFGIKARYPQKLYEDKKGKDNDDRY